MVLAVKKGLKKAVGKTARAVSGVATNLLSVLVKNYDEIAHLYESGLFSIEEIENVIEEGYKEIDQSKKRMQCIVVQVTFLVMHLVKE